MICNELSLFSVTDFFDGMRVDKFIADNTDGFSRERLKELFVASAVFVNGVIVKPSKKVYSGDEVSCYLPEVESTDVVAQNIPIEIIYEDNDIAIINKPQGMVVHPAPGNYENTLVNALMYCMNDLSTINGIIRPGIVHRIDKDTSGLLVIAKNNASHLALSEQFAVHSINREYSAIVHGSLESGKGRIEAPLGRDANNRLKMAVTEKNSKSAITEFFLINNYNEYSHVNLKLYTGRTHQIRVHMKYISHPVIGDKLYGLNTELDKKYSGQLLHAYKLGFIHPTTRKYVEFLSDYPEYFYTLLGR